MVHITHNLSHAILQSVKDTALRFENSEGGMKEWQDLLEEIYSSLSANVPNLDGEVLPDLKEFCLQDCGDQTSAESEIINALGEPISGWTIGTAESRAIRQDRWDTRRFNDNMRMGSLVANWASENDQAREAPEQIMTSGPGAWFLERLRSLCIETEEERQGQRPITLSSDWCREPTHFRGQGAFLTAPPGVVGPTISWHTMIEYLKFIRAYSQIPNWDTGSYVERLVKRHDWLANIGGQGIDWSGIPLHDMFNAQWAEAEAHFGVLVQEAESDSPGSSNNVEPDRPVLQTGNPLEVEPEPEPDEEEAVLVKKGILREILDLLEKQVSESELSEGKYKDYASLLMEVFQGLGD